MFIESLHCEVWFRLVIDGISLNADLNISNSFLAIMAVTSWINKVTKYCIIQPPD